ncbi:unnamed protein product [Sphenostylis stenocarpa]|uniref:Uncharacterized protein n=1 Tax=Sphenostylis stenocarpa TaxID=92480 RepID=A0AA86V761_9FABA|nr:unnamed protein product [Sphenostylis stenocarpa]
MLMEGLSPDEVVFTVCSHAGLVDEDREYFQSMKERYYISPLPDHYACMPHAGAWGALLGACKLYGDSELGEIVANRLFEFEPLTAANYVLLSNIYPAAERWIDVSLVKSLSTWRSIEQSESVTIEDFRPSTIMPPIINQKRKKVLCAVDLIFVVSIEEVAFSFNGEKDSTVLLHILRAGYFLHKKGQNSVNGDLKDFPIRTIYFESPCAFPEINSFTYDAAATYGLQIDTISLDFKSGLEALLKEKPI